MLEISLYLLCYILCCVCYKLSNRMHCFSAYFSRILFPYFADVSRPPLNKIDRLLCASYKVSKFIEFTNIWNHLVCLFARSELDKGQSPPAFLILFLRVSLCFRNCSHSHINLLKPNDIYTYIYMSYRSANLQTLHFKYLFNKYTHWIF